MSFGNLKNTKITDLDPIAVLKAAVKAVPAVKYAVGVVGIAAAAALVKAYFSSFSEAFYASLAMMVLMILLWLFAQAARLSSTWLKYLAFTLAWAILLLFVASAGMLFASVFFDKPKPFAQIRQVLLGRTEAQVPAEPTDQPVKISGTVVDAETQQLIGGVEVGIGTDTIHKTVTDAYGSFDITVKPGNGERVTLHLAKAGYHAKDVLVTPPVSAQYSLDKDR